MENKGDSSNDQFVIPQSLLTKKTEKSKHTGGLKSALEKLFGVVKTKKELSVCSEILRVNPNNFNGTSPNPFKTDNNDTSAMLGVPSNSIPKQATANSAGTRYANATGSGRNKVALLPGHSIMDWIRLTNSGNDLTCGKHGVAKISGLELQKHNKENDGWTAINGIVYNISPYIDFHPGGKEELLRAVGKDSTDLFNQIHPWVNFESMLSKCCVGRLIRDENVLKAELDSPENDVNTSKKTKNTIEILSTCVSYSFSHPTYRWCDDKHFSKLIVDIKQKSNVCPSFQFHLKDDQDLRLIVKLPQNYLYIVHLKLHDKIESESLKVFYLYEEIHVHMIKKKDSNWPHIGDSLSFDNSLINENESEQNFYACKLIKKSQLTHDTFLFQFQLPFKSLWRNLSCEHVQLKVANSNDNDAETVIKRYYTPVPEQLAVHDSSLATDCICLAIKLYKNGAMSTRLQELTPNSNADQMLISSPIAIKVNVKEVIERRSQFYLLSAGTGITPILNVIHSLHFECTQNAKQATVKLFNFNQTEQDIIFGEQLSLLQTQANTSTDTSFTFELNNILSSPSSQWKGLTGRVSQSMLTNWFQNVRVDSNDSFIFICGPDPFVVATLSILDKMNLNHKSLVHVFSG